MFAQLPIPAPGTIENWLIPAAAVLYIVSLGKKVFWRKSPEVGRVTPCAPPTEPQFATKTELHHELNAVRDKIDARFLSLTEKIEHLGTSIHDRLNELEAGLARVDERTKK